MEAKGITIETVGKMVDNNLIDDKAKKRFKRPAYGKYGRTLEDKNERLNKRTEECD